MKRVHFWLVAAALLLIAAALRFHALEADPCEAVGRVFLSDEGWWAHNARNHYLFGAWFLDDWNQGILLAPLHTLLLRASFEWFGLGLTQARLVSAGSSLLTVLLVGILLSRSAGRRTALFGMGILAIDPFSIAHGRVALVEAPTLAMMTLAAALSAPGRRLRVLRDLAAGAAGMGAFLCKLNALAFLPILVLAVTGSCFLAQDGQRAGALATAVRRAASMAAAAGAVALLWFFALVQPNLEGWRFEVALQSAANLGPIGAHLLTKGFAFGLLSEPDGSVEAGTFLRLSLLPVLLSLVWALHFAARSLRQGLAATVHSWTFAELLAATWVAVEIGLLWFTAAPDRRHLWLTVPCAILGAHALGYPPTAGRTVSELVPGSRERWRACGLGVAMAAVLAVYLRPPLASALAPLTQNLELGLEAGLSLGTICALPVLGLCALGALLGPAATRALRHIHLRWGTIALGVALAAGASAGLRLAEEAANRSYELRGVSNQIRAIVGEEATVAGGAVDTLLLGAPNRTLIIRDWTWLGFGVLGLAHLDQARPGYLIIDEAVDPGSVPDRTRSVLHGMRSAVPASARIIRGVHRIAGAEDQPLEFTVVRLSDAQ
jgi:hypothetical protein